ncbi:hypothetical protein RHS03_06090, partial [Rhizoctonia solani]
MLIPPRGLGRLDHALPSICIVPAQHPSSRRLWRTPTQSDTLRPSQYPRFKGRMTTTPHRFLDIFPPGFDMTSVSRSYYSFAPVQLYHTLTRSYDPEKHIESTLVKSVWYGKQTKGVQHEFILVQVEDTTVPITNYMVLDRTIREESSGGTIQMPFRRRRTIGSSQSYCGPAVDAFKVSYNGIENQLLDECDLLPRQYLEKIEFSRGNPLYLYQLVTLVHVVSEKSTQYTLSGQNCYWFAGLIWDCLRSLRPDAQYDGRLAEKRGKFAIVRNLRMPEKEEITETCDAFEKEIQTVDKNLWESRKKRHGFPDMAMGFRIPDGGSNQDSDGAVRSTP